MKKFTSILLTAAFITFLAGCGQTETESAGNTPSSNGASSVPIGHGDQGSADISSEPLRESSDDTSEDEPPKRLSEEELKLISELKQQSFTGPDGETVRAEDAAYVFDTNAEFTEDGSGGFKFNTRMYDEPSFDENDEMTEPEINHHRSAVRFRLYPLLPSAFLRG